MSFDAAKQFAIGVFILAGTVSATGQGRLKADLKGFVLGVPAADYKCPCRVEEGTIEVIELTHVSPNVVGTLTYAFKYAGSSADVLKSIISDYSFRVESQNSSHGLERYFFAKRVDGIAGVLIANGDNYQFSLSNATLIENNRDAWERKLRAPATVPKF
jgi:hypothetical protein